MDNMDNMNKSDKERKDNISWLYDDGTAKIEAYKTPLWYIKARNAIYYALGFIEIILAFRFIFKLLGANPKSGFVSLVYTVTGILTAPFSGIFNSFVANGLVARSVFEPSTVIGMAVYAVILWGLVRLIWLKVSRDGH